MPIWFSLFSLLVKGSSVPALQYLTLLTLRKCLCNAHGLLEGACSLLAIQLAGEGQLCAGLAQDAVLHAAQALVPLLIAELHHSMLQCAHSWCLSAGVSV